MERPTLNILIVEDNVQTASSLREMIATFGGYKAISTCTDLRSSLTAIRTSNVHIALVQVNLAQYESGFQIAAELGRKGIVCIFIADSGYRFSMPELAVDCVCEPHTMANVRNALALASAELFRKLDAGPQTNGSLGAC